MEIEEYLLHQKSIINQKADKIKDFSVFDFNYIPDKPLMREEVKPIIDALLKYEKTNIPTNFTIIGSRGSGKTLMMKFLQKLFKDKSDLRIKYVNCRTYNTSFKILANLINVSARGASLSELFEKFRNIYNAKTVVILDEVDLISQKDKNKEILYLLSRSSNNYMVILLSNNPKFLNELDSSTRSTLQPEILLFKNYDAIQIFKILKQRAKKGLKYCPINKLQKIAALTTQNTNSDVRVAIKTLFYNVTEPEKGILENFERARKDIYIDLINDLNDKNLLILRAIQKCQDKFVKEIYEKYLKYSSELHEKAFSYVYFYNNLSYLQSLGLILLISTKVNRAYTNRITLTFNEKILDSIYNIRFER